MDHLGHHVQPHAQQGRRTDALGNPLTDAYGNPVGEQGYGHETGVMGTGTGTGIGAGTGTGGAFTHGSGGTAQMRHPEQHQKKAGILHRSGSSSSSSSDEDDGMGGRRKKGLKEKIKEKLPGHQKTDEFGQPIQGHGQTGTGTGAGYGGTGTGTGAGYGGTGNATGYGGTGTTGTAGYREPEKKGIMDKVKEKLPGGQPIQGHGQTGTGIGAGYGGTGTGTGAGYDGTGNTTGYGGTGTTTGYGGTGTTGTAGYGEPVKKGMMDKVKEKLPGGQPIQGHGQTGTGAGYGGTGAGAGAGYGGTGNTTKYGGTGTTGTETAGYGEPEKKGMMDKIKEKLPGGHH